MQHLQLGAMFSFIAYCYETVVGKDLTKH